MKHASLFTGIGGFDLAAQWMGWENVFQVEIDSYCQKVLEKNFPNVKRYGDIKEFNGTQYRGTIDVLSGGFPCQPFSVAGKRKGRADNRFLWKEMLRAIREVEPTFIVCENVNGLISMEDIYEQICTEMESIGYKVESYIIPACSVGAIHRRDRLWILSYPKHYGQQGRECQNIKGENELPEIFFTQYKTGCFHEIEGKLLSEPGRIKNYDGLPRWVVKRELIGLGNAIVPQIAFEIFKAIEQAA